MYWDRNGKPPVLECQICGDVIRELTYNEWKAVCDRPYDFVGTCSDKDCKKALEEQWMTEMSGYGY